MTFLKQLAQNAIYAIAIIAASTVVITTGIAATATAQSIYEHYMGEQ